MARGQTHGIDTWGRGRAGLCRAVLHFAVLDARGKKPEVKGGQGYDGKRRKERQRRTEARQAEMRAREAKRWLAGETRGRLSVFQCCAAAGYDYDHFRSLCVKAGDLP